MKIQKIKHIKNCIDGTAIKEILLSDNISKDFVFYLFNYGEHEYMDELKDPFFKIEQQNVFVIKGVENTDILRITIEAPVEENENKIINIIESYENTEV